MQEALQVIQAKETISDDALRAIQGVFEAAFEGMQRGFGVWADGLQKTCQTMCVDLQASSASAFGDVSTSRISLSLYDTNTH